MNAGWKQRREGGCHAAMALFRWIGSHCGRGVARLFLLPIVGYFLLRRPAERRDSRAYLTRVLGRPARLGDVARHIHTFAATILDRLFLLRGDDDAFDIAISGVEHVHRLMDRGGVLLFGSHLGSFEVLRVLSKRRPDARLRVVLDKAHGKAMTQLLDALNPEIAATVIDASQDGPTIMFEIQRAIADGALVALLVDRIQPGEAGVAVPFLGAPAPFPAAPWYIAGVLQAPVALAFGLYRGGNRYDLVFEHFSDGVSLPRRERAAAVPALIARYTARLEHHARSAPYNWFNFYDFWSNDGIDAAAGALAAGVRGAGAAAGDRGSAPGPGTTDDGRDRAAAR